MKQHAQINLDYENMLFESDSLFYNQIKQNLLQLDSIIIQRNELKSTLTTLLTQKYAAVNQSLQAVSPTNASEVAYLATQAIHVQMLQQNTTAISEPDKAIIEDIAYQCPLKLGKPVYLARAMMMAYNDTVRFNNYELCNLVGIQYRKPASIPQANKNQVKVFPNPTKGLVTIETHLPDTETIAVELINQLGQPCASTTYKGSSFTWDISTLALTKGLYFIQIRTSSSIHQSKLIYEN